MPDVIVVGGGIGGLVAARRLAMGGLRVCLLEASGRLGGTVAAHTVDGLVLDAGAESFATRGGSVARLASELGLGDDVVDPNPGGAWLQPRVGRAAPIPRLTLLGIPGSPLAADVIELIGMKGALRAFLEALLPDTFAANSASLGELVTRRMGKTVLDELVTPIAAGVFSAPPEELDIDQVAPGLRTALRQTGSLARAVRTLRTERAGSAIAGIRGGIHRLVPALAADLEKFAVDVRLDSPASTVEPGRVQARRETLTGLVVLAAPGPAHQLGTMVSLATMVVDEPRLDSAPRGSGVLVAPGAAEVGARALTHATAKWKWLAEQAAGRHVLRLSYSAPVGVDRAAADASTLLGVPIAPSSVLDFAEVEWVRPARLLHAPEGISMVGETVAGTGLASVVAHSEEAAGKLLKDFER